ncbi:MAG: amino acid adenylation domain-containing protein [Ilumatobacteraceae bacterium]
MRRALTSAQLGLWAAQRIDPANPALNTGEVVELHGPVDVPRLVTAIEATVAEVDAYGLVFGEEVVDGAPLPWQALEPDPAWRAVVLDVRAEADPRAAAQRWIDADMAAPADLSGADPARRAFGHTVVRIADAETWWYSRAHHLLLDGFGMSLVLERVAERYDTTDDRALPAFTAFTDIADADAAYLASTEHDDDARFWTAAFAGRPPAPSLAERVALSAHHVCRRSSGLDPTAFAALRDRCRAAGVSWPDVVLATVAAYVWRVRGNREVALGLPVMARTDRAAMRCPATTMNVVPLWVDVDPDTTLAELAAQVAERRRALRRHQRYRSEVLRRDLHLLGGDRRLFGPQVNIMPFELRRHFGSVPGRLRNLANGPVDDLTVDIATRDHAGGLDVDIDANPALYSADEVAGHLARLVHLLAGAPLDVPVGDVDALPPAERRLVLDTWNDTAHPVPDVALAGLLEAAFARWPADEAVAYGERRLTYAQLDAVTARLAADLARRGAGPGSLVGVAMQRSVEMVAALVAITRAGAAYVPLDPEYPPARLAHMAATAELRLVLADEHAASAVPLPADVELVVLSPADTEPDAVHDDGSTVREDPSLTLDRAAPTDPAYVIFTSGSTGQPKGVAVPQRAIVNRLLWTQGEYGLGPGDRVLQKTPFGFDVSVWEFFWPLLAGATLVVADPGGHRDPAYLARVIRDERITTADFVPSMLAAFVDHPASTGCGASLRRVICSGEALPADLARRFAERFGVRLDNLYGPTEAAVDVTWWTFDAERDRATVPIGRPVWNTQLRILDGRGHPVGVGVAGELHLAGRQLATGYVGRPDLTAERFVPDPFGPPEALMYRTGDLARWRPDGAVEYLGRTDGQIKLRGQRIELGEIEAVLAAHPSVRAAAVKVHTVAAGDDRLVAYVVPTPDDGDADLDVAALATFAASRLTAAMVPTQWVVLDDLPVSAHGKLDRGALPAPPEHVADGSAGALPRTPRQEAVATAFAEALGVAAVGMDDGFFDLGGHSLVATALVERLNARFGATLGVAGLFAAPTARAMSAHLDGGDGAGGLGRVLPLRRRPGAPTVWCLHPAGGLAWCYTGLLAELDASIGVVGIQAAGLDGGPLAGSIAAMATDAAALILAETEAGRDPGPIHLLGWSVGGVIAHAVAVELRRRGADVAGLVLVDAYPAEQWRHRPPPTEQDALDALLYIAGLDPVALGTGAERDRPAVVEALRRVAQRAGDAARRGARRDGRRRARQQHRHAPPRARPLRRADALRRRRRQRDRRLRPARLGTVRRPPRRRRGRLLAPAAPAATAPRRGHRSTANRPPIVRCGSYSLKEMRTSSVCGAP